MKKETFGVLAATAVAGLLSANPIFAKPPVVNGHFCQNATCGGKSACGGMGNKNGCKGKNSCKGQGWLEFKDEASCTGNGGKWEAATKYKDEKAAAPAAADKKHPAPKKK